MHNITSDFDLHSKIAIKFDQFFSKTYVKSDFPALFLTNYIFKNFFKTGLYFSTFQACIKLTYAGIIFEQDRFLCPKSH